VGREGRDGFVAVGSWDGGGDDGRSGRGSFRFRAVLIAGVGLGPRELDGKASRLSGSCFVGVREEEIK